MTTTTPGEARSLNRWRNRPGRDLLIVLAILYVATAIYAFSASGDITGSLASPFLVAMTLPMGLAHALMIQTWTTLLALAIPIGLIVVLAVRMPWYARIPLLLVLAGASIYVTWATGIVVS